MYKLGIIIPFLNNSKQADDLWKILKKNLEKQIDEHRNDVFAVVCYDDIENPKGLSHQRNQGIDKIINYCNYILFLDADDDIDNDFIEKMLKKTETKAEMLESRFMIRDYELPFEPNVLKNHVTGIAYRTDIIGDNRFDENIKFGEDKEFVERIIDISKMKKEFVDTTYHYNYGANPECMTYRWSRGELRGDKE